jgi:hypothetical protein
MDPATSYRVTRIEFPKQFLYHSIPTLVATDNAAAWEKSRPNCNPRSAVAGLDRDIDAGKAEGGIAAFEVLDVVATS